MLAIDEQKRPQNITTIQHRLQEIASKQVPKVISEPPLDRYDTPPSDKPVRKRILSRRAIVMDSHYRHWNSLRASGPLYATCEPDGAYACSQR